MKNRMFWIRMINLLLIIGLLCGYQSVLAFRENTEKIAYLENELSYYQMKESVEESQKQERQESQQAAQKIQETAESSDYQDGTYTGTAQGFGGEISIQLVIANGRIENIEIISASQEDTAYLEMAQDIIPSILEAQSDEVDTISGATFSSSGIKNAVHQALEQAGQ